MERTPPTVKSGFFDIWALHEVYIFPNFFLQKFRFSSIFRKKKIGILFVFLISFSFFLSFYTIFYDFFDVFLLFFSIFIGLDHPGTASLTPRHHHQGPPPLPRRWTIVVVATSTINVNISKRKYIYIYKPSKHTCTLLLYKKKRPPAKKKNTSKITEGQKYTKLVRNNPILTPK